MAFPFWSLIDNEISNHLLQQLLKSIGKRAENETDDTSEMVRWAFLTVKQ